MIVTLTGLDRENVKADPNKNTNQVVSTISESVSEVAEAEELNEQLLDEDDEEEDAAANEERSWKRRNNGEE